MVIVATLLNVLMTSYSVIPYLVVRELLVTKHQLMYITDYNVSTEQRWRKVCLIIKCDTLSVFNIASGYMLLMYS